MPKNQVLFHQASIISIHRPSTKPKSKRQNQCDTCLVDHGDGSYSYTYQANIANVTEPLTVTYSADATQRATMELELPQHC